MPYQSQEEYERQHKAEKAKMDSEPRIKSVEKGYGEESVFFRTYQAGNVVCPLFYVDEIKQELKPIDTHEYIVVYRGYLNGKLKFEMGASIDVTVVYY